MGVLIRPATGEDYDALVPLAGEIQAQHAAALPVVFRDVANALPRAYFDGFVAEPESAVLVAEAAGAVVGYAILKVQSTPPYDGFVPRRVAVLDTLVVLAARHGEGIGRALVEAALAWARANDASEMRLQVYEFNQGAVAFYERLGFATLSRRLARRVGD